METNLSGNYPFIQFDKEDSLLYHDITAENVFDEISFIKSVSYFITQIEEFHPKGVIVRVYKSPSLYTEILKSFMNNVALKTILSAGIRKLAFYFSEQEFLDKIKDKEAEINKLFPVRFFSDLEDAKTWVLSKNPQGTLAN